MIGGLVAPVTLTDGKIGIKRSSYICPYYLPMCFSQLDGQVRRERAQRAVVSALVEYLQSNYEFIVLPIHPQFSDYTPFIRSGFQFELRYTYELDLNAHLWDAVHSTVRNHIRRASAVEIRDAMNTDFDYSAAAHYESRDGQDLWRKLARQMVEVDSAWTSCAFNGNEIVGGQFVVFDQIRAYNLLSYFSRDSKVRGVPSKLIWDAVCRARARKLRYFDLEGSVLPDIESFYQSFGGLRRTYFQIHWHADPSKRQAISYSYT